MKTLKGGFAVDKERVRRYAFDHELLFLKRRLKEATMGPWTVGYNKQTQKWEVWNPNESEPVAVCSREKDAVVIALSRNLTAMLLREVEDSRQENQKSVFLSKV